MNQEHVELRQKIEEYSALQDIGKFRRKARGAVEDLLDDLEAGNVRAAERDARGNWNAVTWVKKGILLGFRVSDLTDMSIPSPFAAAPHRFSFVDKDLYEPRQFDDESGVRIVPGGSTIRRGACVEKGVVCMPPMYINVGAYVATGTMVDSHALVGSCAQIGERVHLSAAAQIGGVLEPVNANPVVIEDDVLVGGNTGVYEGTIVRERAVLASGVILTRSTPVFDLPNERIIKAEEGNSLEIPVGAVVVQGSRAVTRRFGKDNGLSIYCPIIVKYRDEKTDASTRLEDYLR